MKDELGGNIMIEFVALIAKAYAYKLLGGIEDKQCNGVEKCVVKKTLGFDDFKKCLKDGKKKYRQQMAFRTNKHDIFTINQNKIALNRDDDERIILDDGISTLVKGHYKTIV